ncbi:hypothetical protein WG66_000321, partial [Moniliophthora roreri]
RKIFSARWRGSSGKHGEDIVIISRTLGSEAIQEPDSRRHPIAWIRFHWRQLRDIDVCYTALQDLSALIMLKCETEKKSRRYLIPADDAYSSSVYTPNTANSFQVAGVQE